MTWDEFLALPNGTRVLNHSFDQCVALANLFHEQVMGAAIVPVGSAYQWSTHFTGYPQLFNTYTQIPASADPQPGDIFVSKGGIYNAIDGHIGIVVRAWDGSTFGTKEQNAERNRYVYQTYNRTKANMLSYLRPKKSPIPAPNPAIHAKDNSAMLYINLPKAASDGKSPKYAFFSGNFWLEFEGTAAANQFANQLQPGVQSLQVSQSFWNTCKAAALGNNK